MLNIGCHLSISKGFHRAGMEALNIGANTFQFFTRNPRGGKAKEIDKSDIQSLNELLAENSFAPLFAHASYTMNLCSDKEKTREFAKRILMDDLKRVSTLSNAYYVFHPGSHGNQELEKGIQQIIDALNQAISENNEVTLLLEGMSGKGTEIGKNMHELQFILQGVKDNRNMGVVLDTCHMYSAGMDIVHDLEGTIQHIDKIIGWSKVKGIHLNDSKMPFSSHKDRHERIGHGTIGAEALINMINHPEFKNLPFNLETPNDLEGYKKEIEFLRRGYNE